MLTGEVADFLKGLPFSMVCKLTRERRLPAVRIGTLWRFDQTVRRFARGSFSRPTGAPWSRSARDAGGSRIIAAWGHCSGVRRSASSSSERDATGARKRGDDHAKALDGSP